MRFKMELDSNAYERTYWVIEIIKQIISLTTLMRVI